MNLFCFSSLRSSTQWRGHVRPKMDPSDEDGEATAGTAAARKQASPFVHCRSDNLSRRARGQQGQCSRFPRGARDATTLRSACAWGPRPRLFALFSRSLALRFQDLPIRALGLCHWPRCGIVYTPSIQMHWGQPVSRSGRCATALELKLRASDDRRMTVTTLYGAPQPFWSVG